MSSEPSLKEIEKIQEQLQNLISDVDGNEQGIEEDLHDLEDKVQYLEENVKGARDDGELGSMADLFIEVAHHLASDVRSEKEMRDEIKKLEDDKRTYVHLLNRLQDEDMNGEKRERLQTLIGKVPRKEVESAIKEEKKLERTDENVTVKIVNRLEDIYVFLRNNLKVKNDESQLQKVKDAWVELTQLKSYMN